MKLYAIFYTKEQFDKTCGLIALKQCNYCKLGFAAM